jgi:hypothetical protein
LLSVVVTLFSANLGYIVLDRLLLPPEDTTAI